ncbi:MAG: nucleotidyltransferase domain-containing protein [Anaerolineae bacterium]
MYEVNHEELERISHRYGLDLVVVFGSQATGRAAPGSDVDVAVRMIHRDWDDPEIELDLIGELVSALGGDGDVDIAFLNGASPLLLFEVACTGIPVYQREPTTFFEFQSYAARRYYDHQKLLAWQSSYLEKQVQEWTHNRRT